MILLLTPLDNLSIYQVDMYLLSVVKCMEILHHLGTVTSHFDVIKQIEDCNSNVSIITQKTSNLKEEYSFS